MQELKDGIANASEANLMDVEKHLREAVKKWMSRCIDDYDGMVLVKALAIGRSIAAFLNELKKLEKDWN